MFNIEKSINNALRRAALKGQAISHDKLAAEAGISKQTLYNIFSRDDAKLSHLYGLARALGTSIYDTFEVEDMEGPSSSSSENTDFQKSSYQEGVSQVKVLEEKTALYEDYIQSLKKHINSLEREIGRLQGKDSGGSDGVKQIG